MSNFSIYKTSVGQINEQLLKDCIKALCKELVGAELTTVIQDYNGNNHNVLVGIKSKELPRGIGWNRDVNGNMVAVGDSYGCYQAWEKYSTLGQNYAKAFKVLQNVRSKNPNATARMQVREKAVEMEVQF